MTIDQIKKKAASKAIGRWVREFEDEFDLKAKGSYPTQRMKSIIRKLRKRFRKLKKKRM